MNNQLGLLGDGVHRRGLLAVPPLAFAPDVPVLDGPGDRDYGKGIGAPDALVPYLAKVFHVPLRAETGVSTGCPQRAAEPVDQRSSGVRST